MQDTKDLPYHWDRKMSNRILTFANELTLIEGSAPRPLKLLPSQAFDIGSRFGWMDKRNNRRFRRSYKSMARQNGKTMENGIMGVYISAFCGYNEGKLFTAATKKRQAKLAWTEMSNFIKGDPDLLSRFTIKDYIATIISKDTNCTIEALSKEGGLDDGFRSIYASIDELHQHPDNSVYKALYNGTMALPETLISMITTRGKQKNSFCHDMDKLAIGVLTGSAKLDDFFVDIYCLDEGDDRFDKNLFWKANPYLSTTKEGMGNLVGAMNSARQVGGSDLSDYFQKNLNLWSEEFDRKFVDSSAFEHSACDLKLEDMRGNEGYLGLDFSSGGDLTSIHIEFPQTDGTFYEWSHSWMPRGRLEEHIRSDVAPYDIWEESGQITVTGGETDFKNDYSFIFKMLRDLISTYGFKLSAIGFDPHNADGVMKDLESFGCPLLEIKQSCRFLNDATVDIQLLVKSGKVKYNADQQLFRWSVVNAITVANSFDEIKIDKMPNARTRRIDPDDAWVDAHTAYLKLGKAKVNAASSLERFLNMDI
ncbi:MAG: terminase large subunit [Solobacterium sp.]|jgi:phage terminase large subunit-like protein|nr:terminase large subunit [Solobacterium sp.]MCH4205296.1 terminase large subunit [Solobacterium sp.]MCH4226889.1 terminase large subunit [Solobacterium sp.]MCH4281649.1 terminase large subunit [Solobacterium sp.]